MEWKYISNETNEPNESESEDEEEEIENESEEDTTPVAINEPFHSNQCVVCLSKKPEILFLPCSHYSVCEECEEMNPFLNCPFWRTRISSKFKI